MRLMTPRLRMIKVESLRLSRRIEELNYRKRTFFTELVTAKTRTLLLLGSAGKRKKPGRLGS